MGIKRWASGALARLYDYSCRNDNTAYISWKMRIDDLNVWISGLKSHVNQNRAVAADRGLLYGCLKKFEIFLSYSTYKNCFDQEQIVQFIDDLLIPLSTEKYELAKIHARDQILRALDVYLLPYVCTSTDLSTPAREILIEKTMLLYLELLKGQSQLSSPNEGPAKRSLALSLLKLASFSDSGCRNAAYDLIKEESAHWEESSLMQTIKDSICYKAKFGNTDITCFNPIAASYIVKYMQAGGDTLLITRIDAFIGDMKIEHDRNINCLNEKIEEMMKFKKGSEKPSFTLENLIMMRDESQAERDKFFQNLNSELNHCLKSLGPNVSRSPA